MKVKDLKLMSHEAVYQPREDSLLLADIVWDMKSIGKVLDMGTGSGIQALLVSKKADEVLGVDINPKAIEIAKENAKINRSKNVDFLRSDLFEKVKGKFDLILFNPPYLPAEERIPGSEKWAGGRTGRQIIRRFAKKAKKYLRPSGKILMVISSLTGLEEVKRIFKKKGFKSKVIKKKKIPWETLYALEIKNSSKNHLNRGSLE